MLAKLSKRIFVLFFLISICDFCRVRVPKLISDGIVLQRGASVKIWGWANNPEGTNLYHKEGLPATPFRTSELY